MKTPILFFAAGAAAGVLCMWLIQSSGASGPETKTDGKPVVTGTRLSEEKEKLTARVQALEKELKQAREGKPEEDVAEKSGLPGIKELKALPFDDSRMEEMMKKGAEREVSREVDRLALRLKLTPEQKDALRTFLIARKEQERSAFRTAMKGGGAVEPQKPRQSKDDFLKTLLSPEQQTDYARAQEEQRTAKAEEFAQRKVRKLNNDLGLSEEQKDKFFQAYAQQKMATTDPAKQEAGGDITAKAGGGTVAFSVVGASIGGGGEPVEFEMDSDALLSGGNRIDLDRATVESILTPEQLAVYDQRKAEEQEHMKNMIKMEEGGGVTKSVNIRVGGAATVSPPAKDK